jgi:predicted ATPase
MSSPATRSDPIEIVLTGGPSGGKTSALVFLSARLAHLGYRVLGVPEVPTMLITGGLADINTLIVDPTRQLALEREFLRFQRALRRRYRSLAATLTDRPVVILYDRAELDSAAHLGLVGLVELLASEGLTREGIYDQYDGVICLVSAAIGAEAAYTQANNAARADSASVAVERDRRTLVAWSGHPRLAVIDNSTPFEAKLERAALAAERIVAAARPRHLRNR